jgi:CHASE3 domain sensor protein
VLASVELARASQEVEDSLQLQNTLEKLQLTLVDAEAGQRGFLVTHRPHFLEPYIEAVAKQAYYLGALERQVQGDATRMQSVRALRPMVDDLLRQFSATLTEADSAVNGAGPSLASMNSAKAAMDRVRTAMEGMRAYEQHSLAQSRLEVGQRTRYALVVLVVSNFASVLGLAGLYVGMLRHERQRRRCNENGQERSGRFHFRSPLKCGARATVGPT